MYNLELKLPIQNTTTRTVVVRCPLMMEYQEHKESKMHHSRMTFLGRNTRANYKETSVIYDISWSAH